ncbi:MAG: hypothetical protein GOMPHAMPRED_000671 [Gomphillus americanus]|uniref:Thioester reductase (TE) domain-containing protein n=1 Tax=Gomphillus americanus TaxID=1940652 RepID=A0A8H3EZ27_9LECA|nr:MAG: hypothetical protein GOMPHAMPRED_000671 [Gomphillus americanus]
MHSQVFENTISANNLVRDVLVYGQGKFQSALLIEPKIPTDTPEEATRLTAELWPSIQLANSSCPAYGKVAKHMIVYTAPDKPLPRAGKGTVQRLSAFKLYKDQLEALYENRSESDQSFDSKDIQAMPNGDVSNLILSIIGSVSGLEKIDLLSDLYEHGIDSLQASIITRYLRNAAPRLGVPANRISIKSIYASRTVTELSNRLLAPPANFKCLANHMERIFEEYTADFPTITCKPRSSPTDGQVVLLTGSTGTLGRYLLDQLLSDPRTHKVYCLGRGHDLKQRQETVMKQSGLATSIDAPRIEFVPCDLAKANLGLKYTEYCRLLENVSLVVHSAWIVNFNRCLDEIASIHVHGVRYLINFCLQSKRQAFMFFISTTSAVSCRQPRSDGRIPEEISNSWSDAGGTGYSRSKAVAERAIASACSERKFSPAICRVGQIAGPSKNRGGHWAKQEWFPSLIASSKYLGGLPDDLGGLDVVDWIPVDTTASVLLDLCRHSLLSSQTQEKVAKPLVYHVANSHRRSWSDLLPIITDYLQVPIVPKARWLELLHKSSKSEDTCDKNPSLKLTDFFNFMLVADQTNKAAPPLALNRTIEACSQLANVKPIDGDMIRMWLKQWAF